MFVLFRGEKYDRRSGKRKSDSMCTITRYTVSTVYHHRFTGAYSCQCYGIGAIVGTFRRKVALVENHPIGGVCAMILVISGIPIIGSFYGKTFCAPWAYANISNLFILYNHVG